MFGEVRCGVGGGTVEFASNPERMASPRVNTPPPSHWPPGHAFLFPGPMLGDYFNRIVLWRNWMLRGSCGIGTRSRDCCFVGASASLRADGEDSDKCLGFSVSGFMVIFLGDDWWGSALTNGTEWGE
jgi:hypothetical protein